MRRLILILAAGAGAIRLVRSAKGKRIAGAVQQRLIRAPGGESFTSEGMASAGTGQDGGSATPTSQESPGTTSPAL